MPRLPSALGLGGAKRTGGLDWTLNPPMRSDSPNSPNPPSPPSPQAPARMAATDSKGGGMDFVHYFSSVDWVGGKGRVNPKLLFRVGIILPPSLTFPPLMFELRGLSAFGSVP
eukprot:scaffold7688_cov130-Isochrysis_galbana.AAC.4